MPPRFRKSTAYSQVSPDIETEVLDAYAEALDSAESADLLLKNVPRLLDSLEIPVCFTRDVSTCIDWFYATRNLKLTSESINWPVAEHLLRHLTISVSVLGKLEVSDIVDIDKLVNFCNRLVKFRDNYQHIAQNWALFVDASGGDIGGAGGSNNRREISENILRHCLTLQDLGKVKAALQLDDISDSILIDMLGCGRSDVAGEIFNYKLSQGALEVNIKDFAEVLGLLGHYDE